MPLCSRANEFEAVFAHGKYTDLNISAVAGARRLYSRIEEAADITCGTSDTDVIMRGPGPCVRDAVARAVQGLKNSTVAQVYIEKNSLDAAQKYGISNPVLSTKN